MPKKHLYHVTKPEYVESILKDGLKRSACGRPTMAIYLSESPSSWYKQGMIVFRVDISGLDETKFSCFLPELDEILYWGDIPAERIQLVSGIGENGTGMNNWIPVEDKLHSDAGGTEEKIDES